MKKRRSNKALKVSLIILLILLISVGIFCAIYFLSKNKKMNYFEVNLAGQNSELSLTNYSKNLAPNTEIVSRPITINITEESSNSFLRAKLFFENSSDDNRVLSFVSQLNYAVKDTITYKNESYSWSYYEEDNSFYLMNKDSEVLKTISGKDNNYIFTEKLYVPKTLTQMDSLNSDGDNVQIGENITVRVVFEAIQSDLGTKNNPKIENTREYFNNLAINTENNFTSLNGMIVSYTGTDNYLTLPKFVGRDYIIGVSSNAFNNQTLRSVIIPANYFKFGENAFVNAENLNFIALKNQANLSLLPTSFSAKTSLEIYAPNQTISLVKQNFGTFNYIPNFKPFTEVTSSDISELENNISYLYAPTIKEFNGNFKNFTNLKTFYAPNLTKINDNMFENLSNLVDVDCPNTINVGKSAFYACSNLININLSKKLESIGDSSFSGCSKIKDVSFVKNLKTISKEAFRNCSGLTKIELNSDELEILNGAFYNARNLRTVNISNLSKIENYSFGECNNLYYFNVLKTTNLQVDEKAFSSSQDNSNATRIVFGFNDESARSAFKTINDNFNCILLKTVNKTLTKYEGNLKNLDLSEFVNFYNFNKIGNSAFANNKDLTNLIISNKIDEIGNNFIDSAENLISVTLNSYSPVTFNENSFEKAKGGLIVYVPNLNFEIYKQTLKSFNVNVVGI